MLRLQVLIFGLLVAVSLGLIIMPAPVDLAVATHLGQVLLFPIHRITKTIQFFTATQRRLEDVERDLIAEQLRTHNLWVQLNTDTSTSLASSPHLIRADIIGRDPNNFDRYLYLSRGRVDSVAPGQPVISGQGLVGRVMYAGERYCVVETFHEPTFALSAVDRRTGVHGIVRNRRGVVLDYIKMNDSIAVGDSLYTSGMSEKFPAGILIGAVSNIDPGEDLLFKEVWILPAVRINHLDYAYILLGDGGTVRPELVPPDTGLVREGS